MLTNKEAKYYLELENSLLDPNYIINLRERNIRIDMVSINKPNLKFYLDIFSSKKIHLKLSLHNAESLNNIALLRIDFKGTHTNPMEANEKVPKKLLKYTGKFFTPEEPHIHIYVEGYKSLAWAMPLSVSDFPIKDLQGMSEISDLLINFGKEINLKSRLNIQYTIA